MSFRPLLTEFPVICCRRPQTFPLRSFISSLSSCYVWVVPFLSQLWTPLLYGIPASPHLSSVKYELRPVSNEFLTLRSGTQVKGPSLWPYPFLFPHLDHAMPWTACTKGPGAAVTPCSLQIMSLGLPFQAAPTWCLVRLRRAGPGKSSAGAGSGSGPPDGESQLSRYLEHGLTWGRETLTLMVPQTPHPTMRAMVWGGPQWTF